MPCAPPMALSVSTIFAGESCFAVHRTGNAAFEFDLNIFALLGSILRRSGDLIHDLFGFIPWIFEQTAFMRKMPEI